MNYSPSHIKRCNPRLICCTTFTLLITLAGIAGCATWGSAPDASLSTAGTKPQNPIEPPPGDDSDEATLAAIEDFLARTSNYQVADSPAPQDTRSPLDAREHLDRTGFGDDPNSGQTRKVSRHDTSTTPTGEPFPAPREEESRANARMSIASTASPAQSSAWDAQPARSAPALPTLLSISVREAAAPPSKSAPSTKQHTTNVAVDVNDRPLAASIDDWLEEWESQSDNGRDFQAEWRLRLTQLALGRNMEAFEFAPRLTGETRSLLTSLFHAIEAIRDLTQNPLLTGDRALSRINNLRHALADRADLVIAHVALCRRVVTFGVYEEMDPTDFVSGRNIQTIVYCEIENFTSRKQGDSTPLLPGDSTHDASSHDLYETRLATRIEVFTVDGVSMWSKLEPEIVDRCRRRRTDFFLAQLVTLPPTLPAGEYIMKVYVEDKLSGKAAETTHPFTIHSPVSVAQRR